MYEAYLKIGKTRDGRNILYAVNCDINNGIAVDKSATSKRAAVKTSNADNGTISQPPDSVKLKSTRDSDGNSLSKAQQEYFKDSKVRDEDGNLKVM